MAETAVAFLLDHLVKLLSEEATILGKVHKEVEEIKNQLERINSYIRDAEKKQLSDDQSSVKSWLKSLRNVAFEMEDVIDHYLLKVEERGQRHGIHGAATELIEKVKTVTHRHDIASEIKHVRETLDSLCSLRKGLGLQLSASAPNHATLRSYTSKLFFSSSISFLVFIF